MIGVHFDKFKAQKVPLAALTSFTFGIWCCCSAFLISKESCVKTLLAFQETFLLAGRVAPPPFFLASHVQIFPGRWKTHHKIKDTPTVVAFWGQQANSGVVRIFSTRFIAGLLTQA